MSDPERITIECEYCGNYHRAEYSHDGQFGEGRVYAATCDNDGLTSYYTSEAAV